MRGFGAKFAGSQHNHLRLFLLTLASQLIAAFLRLISDKVECDLAFYVVRCFPFVLL
ncbi:MAG: hypothetical protein ACLPT4_01405 [Verrucomicrobiia bacterium]